MEVTLLEQYLLMHAPNVPSWDQSWYGIYNELRRKGLVSREVYSKLYKIDHNKERE